MDFVNKRSRPERLPPRAFRSEDSRGGCIGTRNYCHWDRHVSYMEHKRSSRFPLLKSNEISKRRSRDLSNSFVRFPQK